MASLGGRLGFKGGNDRSLLAGGGRTWGRHLFLRRGQRETRVVMQGFLYMIPLLPEPGTCSL